MSRYRKIDVKMWGDEKFCSLSKAQPNGQSLWQYLLTGPHSTGCPGIFHIGEMGLCENLNWPIKAFRKAFSELLEKDMVKADWKAKVVVIFNVLRYDEPQSPNVIKKWGKDFDEIPECNLKIEYYQTIEEFIGNLGDTFNKAFQQAFRKPLLKASRIPEPEPKPEPLPKPIPEVLPLADLFEKEFWEVYHARGGKKLYKKEAFEKFCELDESDIPLCLVTVRNYANSQMVKKGIGIKDPHRFLWNGKTNEWFWREWIEPEKEDNPPIFRNQPAMDKWLEKKQMEKPDAT